MKIVWDEPKRLANIAKHRLDFAHLTEDFFATALVRKVRYGRFQAIGRMGRVIAVVFAPYGIEGISVISMRPAKAKERKLLK